MALVIPMANPVMLMAENPLLRQRFLRATLIMFLIMDYRLEWRYATKVGEGKQMLL
jgi:hypothetical protein